MSGCVVRSFVGIGRSVLPVRFLPISTSSSAISSISNSSWHNRGVSSLVTATTRRHDITGTLISRYCTTSASGTATLPPSDEESAEIKKLNELLDEERKKASDFQDKYLRALAENQNTLTRMRKQVDDAKVFGIQSLVKDLLEFSDVLHSALESIPKEEVTESNMHLKNLHVGLTMVSSSLQKVFKKYGVETIDPIGEKFNPNFHEALFQQEVENKEAGTIVAVSKVGFRLSDRVIRPASVGVAK